MKNQFRKGFTQKYKGKMYRVWTVKLGAGLKVLLREELAERATPTTTKTLK